MKLISLALKSIRCRRISHAIIFVQLSVCFAILIYTVCMVLSQFNVLFVSNGSHRGWLYLSSDVIYDNSLGEDYLGPPPTEIIEEYYELVGVSSFEELTPEQIKEEQGYLNSRVDEECDKNHHKLKYMYYDLHESLSKSGLVSETAYNISGGASFSVLDSDRTTHFSEVFLMDGKLYDGLKLNVKNNVDLRDYNSDFDKRYFYALIYPDVSYGDQVYKSNCGVGDVLVKEVYNMKERRYDKFYYEIVGELSDPAYVMREREFSGNSSMFTYLDVSYLQSQTMSENGALLVIRPEEFDRMEYYMTYNENVTLVKPRPDLTEAEYSELLDLIRECGFNVIDLDKAERNTIDEIWRFISENCLILAASLLMVVFSIISISMLSGGQVRREYAVYRLCGADLRKVKALSAAKWAMVFVPSMVMGIVTAIIYSKISETPTHFIALSAAVSGILFAVLYVASFIMSYRSASAGYKAEELSE